MKKTAVCFLLVVEVSFTGVGSAFGQLEYGNYVQSGAVGTPMTFSYEIDCVTEDPGPNDTMYWDFGSGATPAKAAIQGVWDHVIAVHWSQDVTYSTPGDKIVITEPGIYQTKYPLHIYDCSNPSIPPAAIVVADSLTYAEAGRMYWLNPGSIFHMAASDTVFAESGSTIYGLGSGSGLIYMKHSSVLYDVLGLNENSVIYGDGAIIKDPTNKFLLNCPTLDFDYTNAPHNPAFPTASVKKDLNAVSITVSPNPTSGLLHIQGLPSDNITVFVFNILGESAMQQKRPTASDFTLDLSSLVAGTYYIRFSTPNSVVTKKIVRN